MRSGRRFICTCCLLCSILISVDKQFEDFIGSVHLDFAEAGYLHALERILAEIQHIVPEHDEVLDVFVVDFEETDSDRVLAINLMPLHLLKQILHSIKHDARIFVIANHRVRFACTRVTVAKYG